MAIFTVLAPPPRDGDKAKGDDTLRLSFVKDGFTWLALIVPVLWLAFHRMWLVLLAYILVAIIFMVAAAPLVDEAVTVVAALFAIFFALEAGEIRRWNLAMSGWRLVGVAEGRNRLEAERNFFASAEAAEQRPVVLIPPVAPIPPTPPTPPAPPFRAQPVPPTAQQQPPVVGLFPEPGRR